METPLINKAHLNKFLFILSFSMIVNVLGFDIYTDNINQDLSQKERTEQSWSETTLDQIYSADFFVIKVTPQTFLLKVQPVWLQSDMIAFKDHQNQVTFRSNSILISRKQSFKTYLQRPQLKASSDNEEHPLIS